MSITNSQIVRNAAINTGLVGEGLLNPEQARQFLRQTFEKAPLAGIVRHEMRRSPRGTLHKIGVGGDLLRLKEEGVDANEDGSAPVFDPETGAITGYRAQPMFDFVPYQTRAVRLPWETTEEALRENIEGQGLEATITWHMTNQLAVDLDRLWLNGDTEIAADNPRRNFLKVNDGWIKRISNGGHIYDASAHTNMSLDMFYGALSALPNKYNNGRLRWLMSPLRAQSWSMFLSNRAINNGSTAPESFYTHPVAIPITTIPSMPDDKIILADPRNLIVVNTYDMKIRKTADGKEAIMRDMRFYVIHLDFDTIVEELDATCIIENIDTRADGGYA